MQMKTLKVVVEKNNVKSLLTACVSEDSDVWTNQLFFLFSHLTVIFYEEKNIMKALAPLHIL